MKITHRHLARGVALISLLLGACAYVGGQKFYLPPLRNQPFITVPELAVHDVSPEMDAFMDRYVGDAGNLDDRAWKLVWATTDRSILPFKYDPNLTLTSAEAFTRKTGNCLAFANMLIAMARSRGLKAWYQEVEIPPKWTSSNSTLLVSLHINVLLHGSQGDWIVDVSGENVSASRRIRRISDSEALAQHYNNLGADALIEDDLAKAHAYYLKAIQTAPQLPYLWSNIGVVYGRNGQTEAAIRAYRSALTLDPGNAVAANNLYLKYQKQGNFAAAERLKAKVEHHQRQNPYYLYVLSSEAAEQGNYEESIAVLRKAIRLNETEYRFYYELARLQALRGDLEAAQASLDQALKLAPDGSPISGASLENLPELP